MKKEYKNILGIILFIFIILLAGGAIFDIIDLLFKNLLNNVLLLLIKWVLIFTLIILLLNTKTGKNLQKSVFEK